MSVVVYSKPGCQPCKATYRALDKRGIEYTSIDVSTDPEALEYAKSLGHMESPVVVAGDDNWSGFRPDKIAELAA